MKKGIWILNFVVFFCATAFTQTAPKIQRAYAFYTMSVPGMQMTDDKGNPVDPIISYDRFMYIETPGTKMPEIRTVTYNGVSYTPTISRVNEAQVQVGKKAETGKGIVLTPKKGNSFWKVELQLTKDVKAPKEVKHIVIQAMNNKRPYTFNLFNETRLMAPERY